MEIHLVDGTYELFRHYFGRAARGGPGTDRNGAVIGVLTSMIGLIDSGATHLCVATDHVIESFRNELWPGYKDSSGVPEDLAVQFGLLEEGLASLGIRVLAMVELEADDALASAAFVAAGNPEVERVIICTPDKDLAQVVVGERVVQLDRRSGVILDERGVLDKFGVVPSSIPDWLALVGDSADGFPGVARWGKRSAALVLAHYGHIEAIPTSVADWDPRVVRSVRGAANLAQSLAADLEHAMLFKVLATLRIDPTLIDDVSELEWLGPDPSFAAFAGALGYPALFERARAVSSHAT